MTLGTAALRSLELITWFPAVDSIDYENPVFMGGLNGQLRIIIRLSFGSRAD
jgi:hypothetical protein